MAPIDPELAREYEATHYHVDRDEAPFVLAIGRRSPELARLFEDRGVESAAFITACNPASERVEEAANREAQQSLGRELRALGLETLPGRGVNPAGTWPPEASFLVLGIARGEAERIGRRYRQNAIVFADTDAVPALVLLR